MNSNQTAKSKKTSKMSALVNQFVQASLSENTRRAYSNDLQHFINWGGRIPASAETVATYLAEHAEKFSFGTLSRRVVAISRAHNSKKLKSPTQSDLVKATLIGIRRTTGRVQRRVRPTLLPQIQAMVQDAVGVKGIRDKALLLTGFSGAFRRSELVSIQVSDVQFVEEGIVIHLRRSKTDQAGLGRDIAIPIMRGKYCPVKAIKDWLKISDISSGALFRGINRHGQVRSQGLSPQSVALIVKERVAAIGLDAKQFSGHSLRAGLVTSAAINGVSSFKICQQTGHKSDAVMQRYIRDNNLFTDNPLGKIW
ncbi:MAG: tyrosine-type recombinase/integrase [Gammaproteobacteria bacterium]|nr:tyrosine-type recombinase/integrase [Gammaproteobacteria bacterium]